MVNNISIKICTPYRDVLRKSFLDNILRLSTSGVPYSFAPYQCRHNLFNVRNELSLNLDGFTHVLFVDDDVVFKPQNVLQLIKRDKDVISGACESKTFKGYYAAISKTMRQIPVDTRGLRKVDRIGAAFLMIKTSVFNKLPTDLYFRHEFINEGKPNEIQTDECYGFSILCRRHGFDLYIDCNCRVMHINLHS